MNQKKILFSAATLSTLFLAGVIGVKAVQAEDNPHYPPIIQKLAERFSLDVNEVREVFQEEREQRHQEMRARFEERLDQAVEEGKITEEQKEAILAKKAEMQAECEGSKDLSPEERQARMEAHQEEMKAWAEGNGLDWPVSWGLMPGGFDRGHRGFQPGS